MQKLSDLTVTRDSWWEDEHMTEYVVEKNILRGLRKMFINSMKGDKIIIVYPLMYIESRVEVLYIYEVIEDTPNACFKSFGKSVIHAMGDRYSKKAVVTKTKFWDISVCSEEYAPHEVNSQYLR